MLFIWMIFNCLSQQEALGKKLDLLEMVSAIQQEQKDFWHEQLTFFKKESDAFDWESGKRAIYQGRLLSYQENDHQLFKLTQIKKNILIELKIIERQRLFSDSKRLISEKLRIDSAPQDFSWEKKAELEAKLLFTNQELDKHKRQQQELASFLREFVPHRSVWSFEGNRKIRELDEIFYQRLSSFTQSFFITPKNNEPFHFQVCTFFNPHTLTISERWVYYFVFCSDSDPHHELLEGRLYGLPLGIDLRHIGQYQDDLRAFLVTYTCKREIPLDFTSVHYQLPSGWDEDVFKEGRKSNSGKIILHSKMNFSKIENSYLWKEQMFDNALCDFPF